MNQHTQTDAVGAASDYVHVGAYLREMREHFGLDVAAVAQRLHIRTHYIEAIEQGDIEKLPSRVYTLGYVQSYADFLGLESKAIVEAYHSVLDPSAKPKFQVIEPTDQTGIPTFRWMVGGALLCGVIALLWQWMSDDDSGNEPAAVVVSRVEAVPQRIRAQADNALIVTPQNRRCLGFVPAKTYPTCYPLNWQEPVLAFAPKAIVSVVQLP